MFRFTDPGVRLFLASVIALMLIPTDGRTGGEPDGGSGFIAACRTAKSDPDFKGAVLALVHQIGDRSTVLYSVEYGELEYMAEIHHRTPDNLEFMEAQGGLRSTIVASEIIASLRAQGFRLVEDWKAKLLRGRADSFKPCKLSFPQTERYDRGEKPDPKAR